MNSHFMKINPDKKELLLLYSESMKQDAIIKGVIFGEQCVRFSEEVKNIGVWLDKHLSFDKQVTNTHISC